MQITLSNTRASAKPVSAASIQSINSLGGPAIPLGVDRAGMKVTLENFAAQDIAVYQLRVADLFVRKR